ncbi:MAG: response regulator [Oceanicaulis sp.]|nr:response regulator [Oceanicaulis sp.]
MRVLVVDDQPVNLDVTAEMVRQGGCEPVIAASGREALDLLQSERFDAVLMDLHMPGMGGEEAIRRIRAGEAGAAGCRFMWSARTPPRRPAPVSTLWI